MDRFLIGSFEKATTTTGRDVVDLFDVDTRLEYPVLRLFDLSALAAIGIDPNAIPEGRQFRRFYAYYRESDKRNRAGNPYRDVVHLEPIDTPATAADPSRVPSAAVDPAALLAELRAIKGLLVTIAKHLHLDPTATCPAPPAAASPEPEEEPNPVAATIVDALTTDPVGAPSPKGRRAPSAAPNHNGRTYGDGSQPTNGPADQGSAAERAAFDLFLAANDRPPANVQELRRFVSSHPTPEL